MENRANYTLIGLFTLAAIGAGFAFVHWFSTLGTGGARSTYDIVFPGPVAGLRTGSAVLFNGIRVGEVTRLSYDPSRPDRVIAQVAVEQRVPVRADTRVSLQFQGLTGIASVEFAGGRPDAPAVQPGPEGRAVLNADRAQLQDLMGAARDALGGMAVAAERVQSVANRLDAVIARNEANLTSALESASRFARALGDQSERVSTLLGDVSQASQRFSRLSERLEQLAEGIDPQRVRGIVENADTFMSRLAGSSDQIQQTFKDAQELASRLNDMAQRLDPSIDRVGRIIDSVDPAKIQRSLDSVDRLAQTIGDRSGRIGEAVDDFAGFAQRLTGVADRVDRVLANVEGLTGGAQGGGVVTEIAEAAKAFRRLADNFDRRLNEIAPGLARFSGQGLRDFEVLAQDGRRTLSEIERLVRSIERNPQRVIFGGGGSGGVPEFNGGRR